MRSAGVVGKRRQEDPECEAGLGGTVRSSDLLEANIRKRPQLELTHGSYKSAGCDK